jgi:uncharacterized protein YbgA (DUF1722 family)
MFTNKSKALFALLDIALLLGSSLAFCAIPRNKNSHRSDFLLRAESQNKNSQGENKASQKRLETSLSNLFETGRGTADTSFEKFRELDIGNEVENDAPQLDVDFYKNSDKYLSDDGSIDPNIFNDIPSRKILKDLASKISNSPEIPLPKNPGGDVRKIPRNISDQQLLDALSSQNNKAKIDAETLHAKIFQNENGFLNQSAHFRKTLSESDKKEVIDEATAWRRGEDYRRRQQEAMEKIEKEMASIENKLLSREEAIKLANQSSETKSISTRSQPGSIPSNDNNERYFSKLPETILCSECKCLMIPQDITIERQRGKQINQMKCRECYVDSMEFKNGSPFLMGRVDRQGKINSAPLNLDPRYERTKSYTYERNTPTNQRNNRRGPKTEDTWWVESPKTSQTESPEEWRERFNKISMKKRKRQNLQSSTNNVEFPILKQNEKITQNDTRGNIDNIVENNSTPTQPEPSERVDESVTMKELKSKIQELEAEVERYKMELHYSSQIIRELENQLSIDDVPF